MVEQLAAGVVAGVVTDKVVRHDVTASEPSIRVIDMPTADKEYELRVPSSCKKFMLQMRDGTAFKIATVPNGTLAVNFQYFTMSANATVTWDGLNVTNPKEAVFYIACASASKVAEIWQWS